MFQTERMANLLIDVLRSYMRSGKFTVHDFVVMPNHLHVLLTIPAETGLEKAVQFIKGGFSYRASDDLGFRGEIWQRGFSDVRIIDNLSFKHHQEYIHQNPIKAGLCVAPDEFPFSSAHLKKIERQTPESFV